MLPKSNMCCVLFKGSFRLCRSSQYILSYISQRFLVSNYLSIRDQSTSISLVINIAFGLLVKDPSWIMESHHFVIPWDAYGIPLVMLIVV